MGWGMAQELTRDDAVCSGSDAAASGPGSVQAADVLRALPADASQALRDAIAAGCCVHYTVAEGQCVPGGCGTGRCCYHIVSTDCGLDEYQCLDYPCDTGNFSTGC